MLHTNGNTKKRLRLCVGVSFSLVCTKALTALLRYLNLTLSLFYLFFGKFWNIDM